MFLVKTVSSNTDEDPDFRAQGHVRYDVYVNEKKWVAASGLPDHREVDEFDQVSTCAVAYSMLAAPAQPVGSVRLIQPNGKPLPIETGFAIPIPEDRQAVEVSRLAIDHEFRSSLVLIGLFKWVVRESLSRGLDDLFAIVEQPLLDILNGFGFPFKPLGPGKNYFGDFTIPVHCEVSALIPGVEMQDQLTGRKPLAPFFGKEMIGNIFVEKETIYGLHP